MWCLGLSRWAKEEVWGESGEIWGALGLVCARSVAAEGLVELWTLQRQVNNGVHLG